MRSRARRTICTLLSVCAVMTSVVLTGAASADAPLLVATGQVLDASGGPVVGLTLTAFVEPTDAQENAAQPGQYLTLTPFASTATGSDGTWTLTTTDVAGLPRDTDGTIPVLIWGSDARGTVMRTIALEPPRGGALQVGAADVAADATTSLQVPNAARPALNDGSTITGTTGALEAAFLAPTRPGRPQVASRVTEGPSGGADIQMTMGPATGAPSGSSRLNSGTPDAVDATVAASATAPCPAGALITYRLTPSYQDRPVQLANAYSAGKTTNQLQYATTNGSSFQVGVTFNNSLAGVSGTQKASTSSTTGVTVKGIPNAGRTYNFTFRFRKYDIYCVQGINYTQTFSGYSQWRPYFWTGGNSFSSWTPFTCPSSYKASTTASSWWVSREETLTRTAAFSISGGALKATQVYSSGNNVKLTYFKVSSDPAASYTLCGNNDVPANASLVREG